MGYQDNLLHTEIKPFANPLQVRDLETVGQRVARLRKRKGWTQQQLAEHSGIHYRTVSKWEQDKQTPQGDNAVAVARALGVSVDELLGGEVTQNVPRGTMLREGSRVYNDRVGELVTMFDQAEMLRRLARHVPPRDLYRMAYDLAVELGYSENELDRIHEWGKQLLRDEKDRS